MGWHYINPKDADKPRTIPEIEVWADLPMTVHCRRCGESEGPEGVVNAEDDPRCQECGKRAKVKAIDTTHRFYYWYCVPGCLPDSDAFGPYETEKEALDAARSFCDIEE